MKSGLAPGYHIPPLRGWFIKNAEGVRQFQPRATPWERVHKHLFRTLKGFDNETREHLQRSHEQFAPRFTQGAALGCN
jgi:hypothetical protein